MAEALKIAKRGTEPAQNVLSAQGGILEVSPRLRRFLAILADGRVLAAPAALSDPEFKTLKQRAAVAGINLRAPTEATLDEIAATNANVENVKEYATQARQALLSILARAAKRRASDILISRNEGIAEVRYRIHGTMRTDRSLDPERAAALSNAAFNLCDSGDSLASTTRAARAAITNGRALPHEVVGARLQYAPTAAGFALLIRLSYASAAIRCRSLEEAGYSEHRAMAIRAALQSAAGVFLVAGPTEHGKSTTLNLAIEEFARSFAQHPNIVAVEDPPETGALSYVQAFAVNTSIETEEKAFENALLASLRMAPDGIKIGEIRDPVSARTAYRAAGSGALVFATLHAPFATDIPFRLLDLGLERHRTFDPLNLAWISQRLVPTLCPHCARSFREPTSDTQEALLAEFERHRIDLGQAMLAGPGCEACDHSGSMGRCLVSEVILPDLDLLEEGLAPESTRRSLRQNWLQRGGEPITTDAFRHVRAGRVSLEAFSRTVAPASVLRSDLARPSETS